MATSAPGTTESQRAYPEPMDTSGNISIRTEYVNRFNVQALLSM